MKSMRGDVQVVDETAVTEVLREVLDPELGINVVELGMVGPIEVSGGDVLVNMRLTSMSCPFWELFVEQVRSAVTTLEGIDQVSVQFDRTEPWTPELMSEPARRQLEAVGLMPPSFRQRGCSQPDREQLLQIATGVLGSPLRRPSAPTV
jgi:metal-sulfur cluster biosynthetic enzyme